MVRSARFELAHQNGTTTQSSVSTVPPRSQKADITSAKIIRFVRIMDLNKVGLTLQQSRKELALQ